LSHVIGAEEIDRQLPFERGPIAQVVVECHACVVDEDVERLHAPDGSLNPRGVGDVQGQGRDTPVRVGKGLACGGVDPLRPPVQGFLDQRLPDAAIGPGHQHRVVSDCHAFSL
jgi:hypothetical protein